MSSIDTRLAVCGTLAPGKPNQHQLDGLVGDWAAGGYPALTLEAEAEDIDVQVFSSLDLPAHWSRLDAIEGEDYRRVTVPVAIGDALVEAWTYVAAA